MALSKILPASQEQYAGARNLIINGAMQVAQRGTSSTSSGYATVDRFASTQNNTDEFVATYSQSTVTPDGFTTSLKVNVDTAETTLAADEFIRIKQPIEAQNLQHLQYGSSGAKSLTLSFWVRSSVTGKYSVLFYAADGTRSNTQSYTINSADTWEHKTITIDGDTSGTINNDNGDGLSINWILAAGSDYAGTPHSGWGAFTATDDFAHSDMVQTFATTASSTWYITGVQLEVGEQATPFEHRSYADELARCMRYFEGGTRANASATGQVGQIWCWRNDGTDRAFPYMNGQYRVVKRSTPTVTIESSQDGTANRLSGYSSGTNYTVSAINGPQPAYVCMYFSSSGLPAQSIVGYYEADAEL